MKQAKGQLEEAKAVLSKLTKGNRVEDIVKAKAEFDGCIANREYLLYQKNTQSVIKAPFNGVIRTRKNEVGDMASPTSTVFELSMLDKKRIRVYATQVQLENIKVGKTATVDNSLGQTIEYTEPLETEDDMTDEELGEALFSALSQKDLDEDAAGTIDDPVEGEELCA